MEFTFVRNLAMTKIPVRYNGSNLSQSGWFQNAAHSLAAPLEIFPNQLGLQRWMVTWVMHSFACRVGYIGACNNECRT
jgi:hypothetical protein